MILTISWPRFSQLLRELEGVDYTDDELEVRLATYARRAFDEAFNQFGIRVGGLAAPAAKSVADFHCDISGCRDFESGTPFGVDWVRLRAGLNWLRVIAVSIEEADWLVFCDRLFGEVMQNNHHTFAHEVSRIGVNELERHVDEWVRHICWKGQGSIDGNGLVEISPEIADLYATMAIQRAGLRDPLEKQREIDEFRRQEEEQVAAQKEAAEQEWYARFRN